MHHISIFTASIGHGHNEASCALKEQFELQGDDVHIIDTFQTLHPLLHRLFLTSYLSMLRLRPQLWRKIYQGSEQYSWYLLLDYFGSLFCNQLQALLEQQQTTMMVSTHPFVTAFLARLKKKRKLSIPLYTVITDIGLHPAYVRPEVNGYFTASPHIEQFALQHNIPLEQCFCTGIPIKTTPDVTIPRSMSRKELKLEPEMKTVLVTGGSLGLSRFVDIMRCLEEIEEPLQVLCLTGSNKKAGGHLSRMKSKHKTHIIPFTDNFIKYLRASDVVISKPGGLTISEALACETPMIICDPVPGHEEENAAFLKGCGTAVKVEFTEEITGELLHMLSDKDYYNTLVYNSRKQKKPDAAKQIIDTIKKLETTQR